MNYELKMRDIYYNTERLDEVIKICNYLKDPDVRQIKTCHEDVQAVFRVLNYEVKDGYISRKQEEVLVLGC